MIGSIRGKVLDIDGVTLLIETDSGIGYEVDVPGNILTQFSINEPCFLYIQHIVREDAQLLFGFTSKDARLLFREVTKVNGIGARIGLALLSSFDVPTFIEVINQGRVDLLVKTPGIGKKTAERIIVEMKDRLSKLRISNMNENLSILDNIEESNKSDLSDSAFDTISALLSLGFKEAQATNAVKAVFAESKTVEEMVVECLAYLNPSK